MRSKNPILGKKGKSMHEGNELRFLSVGLPVLAGVVALLFCRGPAIAGMVHTDIPFNGNAIGGNLVIGYIPDPHSVYLSSVSAETSPGEPAESVVNHLASAITRSDAIFNNMSKNPLNAEAMRRDMIRGNTLSIRGRIYDYILAGTETGLGIPRAPLFLSCSCDRQARTIDVRWSNPSGTPQYDCLQITWRYRNLKNAIGGERGGGTLLQGAPTRFAIKLPPDANDLDTDIWVKVLRHRVPLKEMLAKGVPLDANAVPSNAAAVHLMIDGYGQEETYGLPFTAGVAPNWVMWSTEREPNKAAFQQGDKYASLDARRPWYQPKVLLTKPYFQLVKAPPKGQSHGVYRKFLGLTPGHTYRLTACLSTMDMDSARGDWSFSVHAAATASGKDLTAEQFAGKAALPDKRSGPDTAQIASFDPNGTTKGKFDFVISGHTKLKDGTPSANITLPSNADEMIVWVRFSCDDPAGKVGLSGVKLEDLTAIKDPKSPQQLIQEEIDKEVELLKWVERSSKWGDPQTQKDN